MEETQLSNIIPNFIAYANIFLFSSWPKYEHVRVRNKSGVCGGHTTRNNGINNSLMHCDKMRTAVLKSEPCHPINVIPLLI